ncbi:MAG: UDP-N-acetylmuramoyl-L-alanyl-D-glutamate--2,6-diaminopimelate ligase [Actinomycetes bacterium]
MNSPARVRPEVVDPRPVSEISALLGLATPTGAEGLRVTGVTHDSRAVRPGDLYAALPGARAHGAAFAPAAASSGAVALLTDPAGRAEAEPAGLPVLVVPDPRARLGEVAALVYGQPARDLLLLGVTGTNGKTTTSYLVEVALRAAGYRTGLVGGVELRVGDTVSPAVRTTPEATDLHALFAVMRERGVTAAAMEVSSHALVLGRVGGLVYDVAAFTNLSQDHLDFHTDLEDYFAAKATMFTPEHARRAVVCVDDAYGRRLAREVAETAESTGAGVPVTTVSTAGADADWRVSDPRPHPAGHTSFRLHGPGGVDLACTVGLPGTVNVANAAVALVILAVAGVDVEEGASGIAACTGVPGRMERVDAGQPFLAVVDYAHTTSAVETLLDSLRPQTKGRLVVVLGAGGDRDRAKRPFMGAAAARGSDVLVVTDDNPRTEDPAHIREAVLAGAHAVPPGERGEVLVVPGRREAIMEAVRRAGPDDTVVLAGKGHEQGQEVGDAVQPFDDRAVLREAIAEVCP